MSLLSVRALCVDIPILGCHTANSGSRDYTDSVIRVRYSGPVRGAHMLAGELSAAGLHADFAPPEERRGAGQDIVHVVMQIGSEAEAGLIGAAAVETVRRVVRAFKERHPEVDADAESDEGE